MTFDVFPMSIDSYYIVYPATALDNDSEDEPYISTNDWSMFRFGR